MGGRKTVGIVHSEAFALLQGNYKKLWVIALIMAGISFVVNTLVQVVATPLSLPIAFSSLPFSLADATGNSDNFGLAVVPMLGILSGINLLLSAISILAAIVIEAMQLGTYNATLRVMDGQLAVFSDEWKRFAANWKRYMAVYGWIMLWTFLWSLLFIIPGIVKSYSYRLAPMLVLRYPDMSPREAIRISENMTNGYKGRLFGIDMLLFLYGIASIIGICVLVVGMFAIWLLWLVPMQLAMYSIVYRDILHASIEAGHMPPEPEQLI